MNKMTKKTIKPIKRLEKKTGLDKALKKHVKKVPKKLPKKRSNSPTKYTDPFKYDKQ